MVEKRFYFAIPDPITIAEQLGYNDIHEVLLAADAPSPEDHKTMASVFMIPPSSTAPLKQKEKDDEELEVSDTFSRTNILVGDNGTIRNIRSVRLSASDIYKHVSENPGDLHFGGYIFESIATSQGPGGLYFAAHDVLGKNFSKFVRNTICLILLLFCFHREFILDIAN